MTTLREELEKLAEKMTAQPMMREVYLHVAFAAANLALEAAAQTASYWSAKEAAEAIRAMRIE